ncbi:Glycosyl transferase, group 1 family protein [Acinetobacter lwoffii]|uniref:glycosyltransferase n=1 Tax=Acinetobacter lwoffii TaxID=28090 RepID=UPI001C930DC9|nr:glycosyltransferase [Acinetobacter lwoffii]QZM12051.1 Glycosyl transferase, group 1 family protein [Acinetobacter lwoffii]
MRILYVITGLGLGGAEKVVCDLADQMILKGHDVKIVYLTGSVLVKPISPRIELLPLHLNSASNVFSASRKYKKIIRDFSPDVVHSHMIHANIFARLNHLSFKYIRLICTAHNSNEGGRVRMLAYKLTNFLSNLNTNVSQEASESLISKGAFNKNNLITVYNGIDLNKFNFFNKDKNSNEMSFLSVGRFNKQKDYPNLFQAISILKNTINKEVKFYIAGDGELRPQLEQLIVDLGISDCVVLLGKRSDIPNLLNKADYFVLSSRHEGLPTVVIEAMACGTFVIATDCGGSAEIMGDTGILVPPQDSKALAEAIKQAVSKTPLEIQENNLKARQRVEELFSLEKSVQNWLKLYEQN